MDTVRFGVIGCGSMVTVHLATVGGKDSNTDAALMPYAKKTVVRGLCDVNLERAKEYQQKYGGEYATDDVDKICNDPDIDAVVIATWHDTHAEFSLKALAGGKHVLIEKPMCMTEQECDDVVAAVDRTGLKYMPAFRARFAKGARDVKQAIPQPDNTIACARTRGIWPETSWAQDMIKGGGQILSQGCHVVDLMFFLAGAEPESVYATGGMFHHTKPEPLDTINAAIKYTNGSVGAFLGGDGGDGNLMMHHALPNGCTFFVMACAKGRSGIALDHGENACFTSCDPTWTPPYHSCAYGAPQAGAPANGLADILPTFAKGVLTDTDLPASVLDGARTTRFILRCFESAKTGKVIPM